MSQTAFEIVYPFACLMAAIVLPVMVTPWMYDKPRKVAKANVKRHAARNYKKQKKTKKQKWFKPPKLTPQQQAEIERYRLGGNRLMVSVGGDLPL